MLTHTVTSLPTNTRSIKTPFIVYHTDKNTPHTPPLSWRMHATKNAHDSTSLTKRGSHVIWRWSETTNCEYAKRAEKTSNPPQPTQLSQKQRFLWSGISHLAPRSSHRQRAIYICVCVCYVCLFAMMMNIRRCKRCTQKAQRYSRLWDIFPNSKLPLVWQSTSFF